MEASWWLWLVESTWLLRGLQRLTVIRCEINLGGTVRVSHASSCSLMHSISCRELWLKIREEWERDFLQCCFWPLTFSTFLMSTFPGLMDLMSGRSQDGLGATRLIKPQGLMASRREACQCLLSKESTVTAGQVSAHIRSAGRSDKGCDGKSMHGPTVHRLKIWELITINYFSFSS